MIATLSKKIAIRFIILLGCISLFADMTYEGARSNGPYLAMLGASGTVVGLFAGLGELIGYGLRLVSGYISDKSHKYWAIMFTGYTLNLLSVPLLAYAGYWQIAVVLMMTERAGKAIRNPTRDAMLSFASKETGRGWGFGLHEFMDQLGATLGPLLISATLYYRQDDYHTSYLMLFIPALFALSLLIAIKKLYPHPQQLEIKRVEFDEAEKINSPVFILYTIAAMCLAAGYADYPLIAYHFKKHALMNDAWIPALYALAMMSEGCTALLTGWLFDKINAWIIIIATTLSMFFAPLVFSVNAHMAITGMVLWGLGMGVQNSVLKAVIAGIIPANKRATAFGLFDTFYGIAWFAGSAYMGYLYDTSVITLIVFSVNMQFITIIILIIFMVKYKKQINNK
ncbi:MAG TPA: MFS transporter [Parafilimonas sp.]|nr:MFS transporter [Parafilimonas sp.]